MLLAFLALAPLQFDARLQGDLAEVLTLAHPDEHVPAIVVMAERYDTQRLVREASRLRRDARPAFTRASLLPFAQASQANLLAFLEALEVTEPGAVEQRQLLWNVNAHLLSATPDVLRRVAVLPGVAYVRWDPPLPQEHTTDAGSGGPEPASIPYSDSFEESALGPEWEQVATGTGQISVTTAHGPSHGIQHLGIGGTDATPSTSIAVLHLDLSTVQGAVLEFDVQGLGGPFDEELDGLFGAMPGQLNATKIGKLKAGPYTTLTLDLGELFEQAGLSFTSDTRVGFSWQGAGALPAQGLTIDRVSVVSTGGPSVQAEPNIEALQAPLVWDAGVEGLGSLILNIDSGVSKNHPALTSQIWTNPVDVQNGVDDDQNGHVDDLWGWNFASNNNDPDSGGHGTNTAGVVMGNGAGNDDVRTGMAPMTSMAVAKISGEGNALSAYQYAADIGADVVTSSHSFKWPFDPDYHLFRQAMDVELAAGVAHANSIGNQGASTSSYPVPWNISAPGNSPAPWRHPAQVQAGRSAAMGCAGIYVGSDELYISSGQGPSAWEDINLYKPWSPPQNPAYWDYPYAAGAQPGLLKPDLCAYTSVKTTSGSNSYTSSFGGTSAATPHLGGALCLLVSGNPTLPPRQYCQALQVTAFDLGPPGKDERYGAGKVQVYDAFKRTYAAVTAYPFEPVAGETVTVDVTGPAGIPYYFILGSTQGALPFAWGALDVTDPAVLLQGVHTGWSTATSFSFETSPAFSGLEVHLQLITEDAAGATGEILVSVLETISFQ